MTRIGKKFELRAQNKERYDEETYFCPKCGTYADWFDCPYCEGEGSIGRHYKLGGIDWSVECTYCEGYGGYYQCLNGCEGIVK